MSLKKNYLKSKPVCKVTFEIDGSLTEDAKEVALVGEFNKWDASKTKMRKLKTGGYTRTLDLNVGKEYQFRYLLDGEKWINDPAADKFVPTGVSTDQNCVVEV